MMTIDYLRARLLSERSISKAAKEKSDELEKRVSCLVISSVWLCALIV